MVVLNPYDDIIDLFKNTTKSSFSSSKVIKQQRKDNRTTFNNSLQSKDKNFKYNSYKRKFIKQKNKFISPYKNFLKNYLWKKKEYSFVLFPFAIKFRKSTVVIKICVTNQLLF